MKVVTLILSLLALLNSSSAFADDIQIKAILVTGASSGIGLQITELLSGSGYLVYAGARKEEDLKRLDAMKNVESVRLDVTVQSDIDAAVKLVRKRGRGLYGLVNNAGVLVTGPLIEVPVEQLQWLFDVNVYGPYRLTQAFAPLIIESKGRIVNISSIHGISSHPFGGHYSMSKHALEAFTDSLAAEMERFGVNVSVVEPGSFKSNAGAAALERLDRIKYWDSDTSYPEELKFFKSPKDGGPPRIKQDPVEVAQAVKHALFSATPKRRYLVAGALTVHSTLSNAMVRILQLNQDQPHTMNRNQLIKLLDQQLEKVN